MTRGSIFSTIRIAAAFIVLAGAAAAARAATPPQGFQETVVFTGLSNPTQVRFLPDGRVLVAEKSGLIKMFASLTATTPTIVADLRTNVHNFWDRGLLGLAVDPDFANNGYIYVTYAYDAAIGGTAPRWGTPAPRPTAARRLRGRRPTAASSATASPGSRSRAASPDPSRSCSRTGASSTRATRPAPSRSAPTASST